MRNAVVQAIVSLMAEGHDIHFLTADLGFRVLDPIRSAYPDRFTNVGVAEANMVSVAAGLALTGKRPVCYSMVPFLLYRAFEQVRYDVVAHSLPVVLVGVGGGLSYGHEGTSHHAIEDIGIARGLPGLQVVAPGDPHEATAALRGAIQQRGPTFIRLGQNGDPAVHGGPVADTAPRIVREGVDDGIAILATGHILRNALGAADQMAAAGLPVRLLSVPRIKPLDGAVAKLTARSRLVVTVEEHSVVHGFGAAISDLLHAEEYRGRILRLGLPDQFCDTHGTLPWLRKLYRLDPEGIAARITETWNECI